MAKKKIQQKIAQVDFKQINENIKAGTLHVVRDPKPGAIKMDHVSGRVTQAFNLGGKKIEFETNAVIHNDDCVKFGKLDDHWYLIVTSKHKQ